MTELGIEAEVLVANVVAADPDHLSVHDHVFAVVAEVELEAVVGALGGVELGLLDAGRLEFLEVGLGETRAADFVKEHEDFDAAVGAVDQRRLEPPPETVVVDDVELDQGVVLGLCQTRDDAVEGGVPVHQQCHVVAVQ